MNRVTPVNFVQHKPKMATDYTPYMEMKSNVDDTKLLNKNTTKPKQSKEEGHGLSLQLGEEYERKKQKLKEELRLDYRHYVAKKKELGAGDPYTQPQIWPPLRERRSTKPPGRDPFGSATPSHTLHSPDPQGQRNSPSPERLLFSKRDVGTVTDPAVRSVPRPSQRRWEETLERKLKHYTSEEELNSEEEQEELELLQKKRVRNHQVPGHAARRERRIQHSVNSVPVQDRAASKKNMVDFATGLMIGAVEEEETAQKRKARYRLELLEQIAEQRKNKRKEKELDLRVAATGAIDPEKQPDRIKQFAAVKRGFEGRKKDIAYRPGLELDPLRADLNRRTQEEKPTQKTERREPPDRPRVAFQSPILEYSAALGHLSNVAGAGVRLGVGGVTPLSEEFQKGISGALGEMVSPRVISVPPPPVPALSEAYSTPYDDAYYYYGARNPLDPNLPYYGPPEATVQSLPKLPSGAHTSILHPAAALLAQARSQHDAFPPDRHQQPKENTLSYKDALKQQIEDRQERRQREREERAYNDAKLEAEMKAYEPWGRGGGGAPLRDDQGNLISDLKRMHRTNEEAYINQESHGRRAVPPRLMEALSSAEDKESSGHIVSGFTFTQASPYARGNIFSDLPTTQQLHEQERYKESLKQQIEEKRRIEADTKERLRLEEEREEKRLAEQRARIQKEYEEEQEKRKRKEVEQNAKNQEMIRQAEERRKEIERRRKEEEAKDSESVRQQYEQERQARLEQEFRSQSPPIPTVQKRLGYKNPPRPPSLESRRSAAVLSSLSVSAPLSPPVPAQRNQIRASEEQQGVINELSVLRKRLRSEQRRLEGQLLQSEREDMQSPLNSRAHRPLDVFDMARLKMHVPARRPSSNARPINQQNVQEFNQLKYRDSESREQVRQVYPEPPGDEVSLELQQQALLREQQRRLNHMRRARDYFDLSSPMKPPHPRKEILAEEAERHSLLHSESAFIDPNGYSFPMTPQPELRAGQSSARERRRQARRLDLDDGVETPGRETNSQPLSSVNSFQMEGLQEHNQRRMKTLDSMSAQGWKSGQLSADEDDDLWQQSPSPVNARRVSTTTVATEPWLRPGTTETLKGMMAGRRPSSREWEGPSTYHG